jgi:excisionase family DNA binding protein
MVPNYSVDRVERGGSNTKSEPLAVPMAKAPEWLGVSRSKIYEEIQAGRLRAVKCGSRTLIPYTAGEAWLEALPQLAA